MTPGLPSSEARERVASGQPQPPLVTVLSLQTSGASEPGVHRVIQIDGDTSGHRGLTSSFVSR